MHPAGRARAQAWVAGTAEILGLWPTQAMRYQGRQSDARSGNPSLAYGMALARLGAVTLLFLAGRLSSLVAVSYWALSVVSVIAYALDKSAALIAQQLFRHKTKKREFRAVFWTTVLVCIAAVAWLLTTSGTGPIDGIWNRRPGSASSLWDFQWEVTRSRC